VGISRMFITGVSPVTMDDVTSGFNIGENISLYPAFNEILGLNKQNVIEMLTYYHEQGVTLPDLNSLSALMNVWYGNYRFSKNAKTDLFNTDMVLYFLKNLIRLGTIPDEMIDPNVKVDYEKLRHLIVLDRRLNGNFSHLKTIIETGGITSKIAQSFPLEDLIKPKNFISLLYYFGLLTQEKDEKLIVPNRTVLNLMYEYFRNAYEDVDVFTIDLWHFANLIRNMAYQGDWQPVFQFLADEVDKQTAIRDFLSGEKVIQTFLLAYLNVADYYISRTEVEMGKGFVDLYLEPFFPKYEEIKYAYLIELKYITQSKFTSKVLQEQVKEAKNQLRQYAADPRVVKGNRGVNLISIMLIFRGWELVHCEEVK
ncbi:hypothetical protein PN36_35250, partial [Candidatus Thiomargarita nelsonii]